MLKECFEEIKQSIYESPIHTSSRKVSLIAKLFEDVTNNKEILYNVGKNIKSGKIVENKFFKYLKAIFFECGIDTMIKFAKISSNYYEQLSEDPVNIKEFCKELDSVKTGSRFSKFIEIDNGDVIAFNNISKNTWDKKGAGKEFKLKSEDVTDILEYFASLGYLLNYTNQLPFFPELEKTSMIENSQGLWDTLLEKIKQNDDKLNSYKLITLFNKFDTDEKRSEVLYYVKELLMYINDNSRYDSNILVEDMSKLKGYNIKILHSEIGDFYKWQTSFLDKSSSAKNNTADVALIFSKNGINLENGFFKSGAPELVEGTYGTYKTIDEKGNEYFFMQVSLKKGKKEARIGKITTDVRNDIGNGILDSLNVENHSNKLDEGILDTAKGFFKKSIEFSKKVISNIKSFFSNISNFIKSLLNIKSAEKEISKNVSNYFKKVGINEAKFSIKQIVDNKETKKIIKLGNTIIDNFLNNYASFSKYLGYNDKMVYDLKTFKNILNNLEDYKKIESPYNTPFSEAEFAQIVVNVFVLDYLYKFLTKFNEKSEIEIANSLKKYEKNSKMGNTENNLFIDYLVDKKVELLDIGQYMFSGEDEVGKKIKEIVENYKLLYFEIKMTSSIDKSFKHTNKYLVINTYFIKDIQDVPTFYHIQWNKNGNTFRVEYNSEKTYKQVENIMSKD